ncbi:MAG: hypothetical protein WCG47_06545 [Dermatophilaceae bacterium]
MTERPHDPGPTRGAARIWAALKPPEGAPQPPARTPRDMVTDLYGITPRGAANTAAAATALGTSQRTIQRWIRAGLPRRSPAAERMSSSHRTWRDSTPEGRRQSMTPRQTRRLRRNGATVAFFGRIKISRDDRVRATTVAVSAARMRQIMDATLAGDDAAALRSLEAAFSDAFGGSVSLEVSSLELT